MIEVQDLWKNYGEVQAVKGASFTVKEGEIVGFLGPNGAGKTTTMRVLTCFMPPSRGRVRVAGHDVLKESMAVRRTIGYLPEIPPLYQEMTVEEYLRFVGRIKGLSRKQLGDAVDRVIEICGLAEMRSRHCRKLSKGYRQRTGLAQALIHDPPVLILDEPTIGLDPRQIAEIRALIKGLAGTRTVILSTHILSEVTMTCQRAIIINRGRIVMDDTLENLTREGDLERQFLKIVREAEGSSDSSDRDLPDDLRGHEEEAAAHNPGPAPHREPQGRTTRSEQ